ncbi:MAG: Do family serine endopeptidase [Muribaculaceae bacterium]
MKNYRKLVLLVLGASIFGSALTIMATTALRQDDEICGNNATQSDNFIRTSQVATRNPDFTVAAESTINAVVSIKSFVTPRQRQSMQGGFMDPFEFFFGPGFGGGNGQSTPQQPQQQQKPQQSGLGSGVIISEDGYIVTNNHVVDGAEKLEITLNDNRTFNAKVIGTDATTDIALIKIEAKKLPTVTFGDSDGLRIGEWVLAVGNPFGFTSTVTAGIVSAKARSISSATHGRPIGIESFIQTDAAVNPGNSGGALVNIDGLLVGINTAIYSQTGNYAGYSFAIPSSIVKKVITDIKQYGAVQRAVLGISFSELTSDIAKEKGITAVNEGIYVGKITDRSAAMEAGLKEGDVITRINDVAIKNSGTMQEQMSKFRPGDKINVTYIRDNKSHSVNIVLRNNQGDTSVTKSADLLNLGCAFKELDATKKSELQISQGLEFVGIKDGRFKNAGIKNGFVITDINNVPVSTREDVEKIFKAIMADNQSDKVMFITGMYPTGRKVYYAVDLAE